MRERNLKPRLFTIDQANAMIPRLESIMGKLQRHGLQLRAALSQLVGETEQDPESLSTTRVVELRPELAPVVSEVEQLLGELQAFGVQLKGLDLGLIDFFSQMDDEIVLLCWQYGESEVGYYHTIEAGFAGRKPLDAHHVRPKYLQ